MSSKTVCIRCQSTIFQELILPVVLLLIVTRQQLGALRGAKLQTRGIHATKLAELIYKQIPSHITAITV